MLQLLRLTIGSRVAIVIDKPTILHRVLKDALRREVPRFILRVYQDPSVAFKRTTLSRCALLISRRLVVLGVSHYGRRHRLISRLLELTDMVLQRRAIGNVSSTILASWLRPEIYGLLVVDIIKAVEVLLEVGSVLKMRVQSVTWQRATIIIFVRRNSTLVGRAVLSVIEWALAG